MKNSKLRNIIINTGDKRIEVCKGDIGIYDYKKIKSCELLYRRSKDNKLIHENDLSLCTWGNLDVKVVVRMKLEDDKHVCVDVSEEETQWKSLQFHDDCREANEIMKVVKKIIQKYK